MTQTPWFRGRFTTLGFEVGFGLMASLALIFLYALWQLPSIQVLEDVHLQVPLKIYSQEGALLAEYGDKRRIPLTIDQIPKPLIHALLATEDARFYEHQGVDTRGLLRAAYILLSTGHKEQGGSTITMQVARNFFLTREKTFTRKLNEILLALKIERELPKEKILELYLNKVYFGKRAYGVAAAAEVYFGKTVSELTLPEMALLAGLPQAPSAINPLNNLKGAIKRRNHVLSRMLHYELISPADYEAACAAPLEASYHARALDFSAPYAAEMVRQILVDRFGEDIYTSGYAIYTTLQAHTQEYANEAVKVTLEEYNKAHGAHSIPEVGGALVALDPATGAIRALVGGYDFETSKFNRATQALRQPGSNFKPFIYAAAFEQGYTPATLINDAPVVFDDPSLAEGLWRPQNDNKEFYGPTRLRLGLTLSRNLVSIRLLQEVGISKTIPVLERFGFSADRLPRELSLALGTLTTTPLEMATAYATFANGGYKIQPYLIDRIEDRQGKIIEEAHHPRVCTECDNPAPRILSAQDAYFITHILQDAIQNGTSRSARSLGRHDLAGKTGTTNNQNDAWYSGYNQHLVVTTWMGFDEPRSLNAYAAQTALPLWIRFMSKALKGVPDVPWPEPEGLVHLRIDPTTGLLAHPNQSNAIIEIFKAGQAPTRYTSGSSGGEGEGQVRDRDIF